MTAKKEDLNMIRHTDAVLRTALKEWMLVNQDDTGCREAANALGNLGGVSVLMEMLDGSITARCAAEVACALGTHGDGHLLPGLYRLRAEFGVVTSMLDNAIEMIPDQKCTCDECGADTLDEVGEGFAPNRTARHGKPPADLPHLRN